MVWPVPSGSRRWPSFSSGPLLAQRTYLLGNIPQRAVFAGSPAEGCYSSKGAKYVSQHVQEFVAPRGRSVAGASRRRAAPGSQSVEVSAAHRENRLCLAALATFTALAGQECVRRKCCALCNSQCWAACGGQESVCFFQRLSNPAVKRTVTGKPAPAAYLER